MRWYYGWNVVGVGLAFQAVTFGLTFFSFTFWVVPWMDEFGATRGEIMIAVMATNIAMGAIAPFAGPAMDRLSIRMLVCLGAISFSAGFALIAAATALWQIIAIYASLITLGTLFAGPLAAQTLAAKWFRAHRGMAIGWSSIGTSIGGFVLPLFVVLLLAELGWRTAHLILAALALVVILPLVWTVVRSTPEEKGIEPEPDLQDGATAPPSFPDWTTTMILRQRSYWVPICAFLPVMTAFGSIQFNLAPYVVDLGFPAQRAALLMSLLSGTMIGGKLFFGAMADRWDHRALYWLATGVMAGGILLLLSMPGYALLLLACVLLGFAAGGFLPLLGAIFASRFGPSSFGRVMGLTGPILTLSALGPVLMGWIRDTSGSYLLGFQVMIALMVPLSLVMILLRPPQRAPLVVDIESRPWSNEPREARGGLE